MTASIDYLPIYTTHFKQSPVVEEEVCGFKLVLLCNTLFKGLSSILFNTESNKSKSISAVNWNEFRSQREDVITTKNRVDFSIQDPNISLYQRTKQISFFVLKVFIFPWGTYDVLTYILQRLIMIPLYPAQSGFIRGFSRITDEDRDEQRESMANYLTNAGFVVRHVILKKNNVSYSGFAIGTPNTLDNGKWVTQSCGNMEFMEGSAHAYAQAYNSVGYNTLIINGPCVGRSEGHANVKTMGEVQEIGLCYLETAIKAKKIVMAGMSLGGAASSQAILKHEFKSNVKYLAVRQMTFDRSSNICGEIAKNIIPIPLFGWFVKKLVKIADCEMDSVLASKRLSDLDITEVVVQQTNKKTSNPQIEDFISDGVIRPKASLGYALIKEGITKKKVFCCDEYSGHCSGEAITVTLDQISQL